MRFMLITSLIALAPAGIVVSCSAEVQPTPTELATPTPTEPATPTLNPNPTLTLREKWALITPYPTAMHTPSPTRTTTPTPDPSFLTATVEALATATEEAKHYKLEQLEFATTVARGENEKCSESALEKASSALTAGRDLLTGNQLAMLVQAHVDALDCSEFPTKDSEDVRCLRDALVFLVPHYERIGSKRLRHASAREATLLRTASENSSDAVQRCREAAFPLRFFR